MRLDVVGDRSELSSADVLADVRHPLLDTAGHVVAPVCHAPGENMMMSFWAIDERLRHDELSIGVLV